LKIIKNDRLWCHRWPVALLLVAVATLVSCGARDEGAEQAEPETSVREVPPDDVRFVGSAGCVECHREQYLQWSGSHHDLAMGHADGSTVLADFSDVTFSHFGVTSHFFRKDGRFFVRTEGLDGTPDDFEIKYTFGVEPLQQYLIEFPGSRLQSLTIAWDTGEGRWFHLYPDEKITHDDPLHWTGRYQSWNLMCAECHSTNLRKGYDPKTDSYQTTWSEIDVGCEACHGPGSAHVEWARGLPEGQPPPTAAEGLVVDFRPVGSQTELEVCAPCHSRRHQVSDDPRHGRPFLDDFMPELLRAGLYHADGQILEEVYVYGSFLQSRMYRWGVRCSDCHEPHSLTLVAPGDALCVQCHREQLDPRFPTLLLKSYNTPAHHFHPPWSSGARCVDCHMLAKNYMVVDPRHDHSFRVPRPDLSLKLGTPNTCNACHADRSAEWAADVVAEWYGPSRRQDPHFGEAIAAGRAGAAEAEAALVVLAADIEQPAIVRATALELLQGYGREGVTAMITATRDQDPLVRAAAVGGLDHAPTQLRAKPLVPRLEDPVRAVRTEAARVLASVSRELLNPEQRDALEGALAEYREAQGAQADMPAGRLNLAVLHESLEEPTLAEREYRTALRLDADFLLARFNLANLYNRLGRNADAEAVLREGIERAPDEGELHYSLGLLLVEEQRLDEAEETLARATELLPDRARPRYNRALLLQQLGRTTQAEQALLEAQQLDARDPDILYALVVFYAQQQDWSRALPYARALTEISPGAPGPQQLLRQIQKQISSR
jgi:tetratricopeptide (TPR) repeat protein